ncbi:Transforming growth factor beta-1-induced transcript 1 protein, partial [Blyttiomyces sp. JEL0837]
MREALKFDRVDSLLKELDSKPVLASRLTKTGAQGSSTPASPIGGPSGVQNPVAPQQNQQGSLSSGPGPTSALRNGAPTRLATAQRLRTNSNASSPSSASPSIASGAGFTSPVVRSGSPAVAVGPGLNGPISSQPAMPSTAPYSQSAGLGSQSAAVSSPAPKPVSTASPPAKSTNAMPPHPTSKSSVPSSTSFDSNALNALYSSLDQELSALGKKPALSKPAQPGTGAASNSGIPSRMNSTSSVASKSSGIPPSVSAANNKPGSGGQHTAEALSSIENEVMALELELKAVERARQVPLKRTGSINKNMPVGGGVGPRPPTEPTSSVSSQPSSPPAGKATLPVALPPPPRRMDSAPGMGSNAPKTPNMANQDFPSFLPPPDQPIPPIPGQFNSMPNNNAFPGMQNQTQNFGQPSQPQSQSQQPQPQQQQQAQHTCATCSNIIQGPSVSVFDNHWHPNHFVCSGCEVMLTVTPGRLTFQERDGEPFCLNCFNQFFTNGGGVALNNGGMSSSPEGMNGNGSRGIMDSGVKGMNGEGGVGDNAGIAQESLQRNDMNMNMNGNGMDSSMMQSQQSQQQQQQQPKEIVIGPPCGYCEEEITGRCITALGMTWHPEHFF